MCGRFTHEYTWAEIHAYYNLIDGEPVELAASWNTAPTQQAGVVVDAPDGARYLAMRWGLIPGWAEDMSIGSRLINARAETVAEKPAFRSAFRNRRCVIPASGFYEWKRSGSGRSKVSQPYYVTMARPGGTADAPALMSFAGLWERWKAADGSEVLSFTIITTAANQLVAGIHDRMPVILGRSESLEWLGAPNLALLRPCRSEWLRCWPVSRRVNTPRNDDSELIQPMGGGAG
jgi:putative SOS response-associated peptidase YedK